MSDALARMLGADPLPWLLTSDEPSAVWIALTRVRGRSSAEPTVVAARTAAIAGEDVLGLVERLPAWGEGDFSGHDSPAFAPNLLGLLADLGVTSGDFPQVDEMLDAMVAHQDAQGRFSSFGKYRSDEGHWGTLLCDTHAIAGVLLRYGHGDDPRVSAALKRAAGDVAATPQGRAWRCEPDKRSLFRGPGRKADVCPQVTLEALRAFSLLPVDQRPEWLGEAARTPLEVWRRRAEERPYQFGHGYQFKTVKWPAFWYGVLPVVETLGRFPDLWSGPHARAEDRRALVELAACLIAYNTGEGGRVTPRRAYRGFESLSLGQKRKPSPVATALLLAALAPLSELAAEIIAVDVASLPSSKGGSGTPVPPKTPQRGTPREPVACPAPTRPLPVPRENALARLLARHHLGTPWVAASAETIVSDIVGLQAVSPSAPYLALAARLPTFARSRLDGALYDRHTLSLFRCMRGMVFAVRSEMLPTLFAATERAVRHHSARFLGNKGVSMRHFELLAKAVLERIAEDGPLTIAELHERLHPHVDAAAVVTHMCNEGMLLRDRPTDAWPGRRFRYARFSDVLPGVRLDTVSEEDGTLALVRAYVRAFGPVAQSDIVWWTGAGRRRTAAALETMGDEIVEVAVEGTEEPRLMHAADVEELESATQVDHPSVALLPALDPLLMGVTRRELLVADESRPYVLDRGGRATSVVLVDGRVAGVWDVRHAGEPGIVVHLFGTSDARTREAVEIRAADTAQLLFGHEAELEWRTTMPPLGKRPGGSILRPLRV
jgi:hypothetical protein